MASNNVTCSPKTFSPRVLIHRTDYNGHTNTCIRGKSNVVLSRKSLTASPLHDCPDQAAITITEPIQFEFRERGPDRKQSCLKRIKLSNEALKMEQAELNANRNGLVDQRYSNESGSDYWNEANMSSQSMTYFCRCCKCCLGFSEACLQQAKDTQDFRAILPHLFKLNDDHLDSSSKEDCLRWTLFNSSVVNKHLLDLSCNQTSFFDGPIWSNRWIYPALGSYTRHIFEKDVFNGSKELTKSFSSNNFESSIASRLSKTLPIPLGSACYNICGSSNANRVFWPLLSPSKIPEQSYVNSMPCNIPPSSSITSIPKTPTTPPSLSSLCLFRQASFFAYDSKQLSGDGVGSSGLGSKLNREPPKRDESTCPEKRSKYSDKGNTHELYYFNAQLVDSVTKQNSAGTAKTTAIYKVPKDSVNEKRQIQKLKNFHCPFCNISCSNRGQLQGHVRIHTGERPFVCEEPQCRKAFIRNEELTRHRRIHTGERPHICSICKKAFTRKDHLSKHMKTHA